MKLLCVCGWDTVESWFNRLWNVWDSPWMSVVVADCFPHNNLQFLMVPSINKWHLTANQIAEAKDSGLAFAIQLLQSRYLHWPHHKQPGNVMHAEWHRVGLYIWDLWTTRYMPSTSNQFSISFIWCKHISDHHRVVSCFQLRHEVLLQA
jgi:hypothetical protein